MQSKGAEPPFEPPGGGTPSDPTNGTLGWDVLWFIRSQVQIK